MIVIKRTFSLTIEAFSKQIIKRTKETLFVRRERQVVADLEASVQCGKTIKQFAFVTHICHRTFFCELDPMSGSSE